MSLCFTICTIVQLLSTAVVAVVSAVVSSSGFKLHWLTWEEEMCLRDAECQIITGRAVKPAKQVFQPWCWLGVMFLFAICQWHCVQHHCSYGVCCWVWPNTTGVGRGGVSCLWIFFLLDAWQIKRLNLDTTCYRTNLFFTFQFSLNYSAKCCKVLLASETSHSKQTLHITTGLGSSFRERPLRPCHVKGKNCQTLQSTLHPVDHTKTSKLTVHSCKVNSFFFILRSITASTC